MITALARSRSIPEVRSLPLAAFGAVFLGYWGFPAPASSAEPWAGGVGVDARGGPGIVAAEDAVGADEMFDPRLAIQFLDQVAGAAHCGFRDYLKAEGAWPPCGRDIAYHRALCDLVEISREMRVEARKRFLSTAVLRLQVAKCRSIAARIERNGEIVGLPHCVDESVQDALDLIAMLDAFLNPADT